MSKLITVQDGDFTLTTLAGNLVVNGSGYLELANNYAINWLDADDTTQEMLNFESVSRSVSGVGSVIANFEGTDGDRTYTGDDGRIWTFGGSTADNEISNVESQFGSTSYLVGGQGAQDDHIITDIEAEYTAGDFVCGTRDWFVRFWLWMDTTQIGGHDIVAISPVTTGTRDIRWSINNNTYTVAYAESGPSENTFPTFGASASDSVWHEIVCERVGNGIYWYEDGVQQGSTFDCTGDDIGGGLTGDAVVVLGSSINNAVAGITPTATAYMDAFEMRIGENIYGGVAPGSPQTAAPVTDIETLTVGDPNFTNQIDGLITNITSPATTIQGTTDLLGTLTVGGNITAGELTWDGQALLIDATGGVHGMEVDTSAAADKSYMGVWNNDTMQYIELGVHGSTYAGTPPMTMQFATTVGELQFLGDNGNHLVMRDITFVPHTDIPAGAVFRLGEKAAAGAFEAAYGQIWVRDDAPTTLIYSDDAGTDFVIGGSGFSSIADGATTSSVLRWGGSAWIEEASVTIDTSGRITVPQLNEAATPTLAFGDGDTGLYESVDDVLHFSTGGSSRFNINAGGDLTMSAAGRAVMMNEVPTATNPVFVPGSDDPDTGVGVGAADQLALIAGGVEMLRLVETGTSTTDQVIIAPAGIIGTAATPALAFGDGDTGLYESVDDNLVFTIGGTSRWIANGSLFGSNTGAGGVLQTGATAIRPGPTFANDLDTGIGTPGANQLSLIAGGVEANRIVAATVQTPEAAVTEIISVAVASGEGFGFEVHVMGTQDATGDTVFERIFGAIRNQGGTTALVGSTIVDRTDDAGATTWVISVEADDTGDALTVDVTGEASHTIDWKVRVELLNV